MDYYGLMLLRGGKGHVTETNQSYDLESNATKIASLPTSKTLCDLEIQNFEVLSKPVPVALRSCVLCWCTTFLFTSFF